MMSRLVYIVVAVFGLFSGSVLAQKTPSIGGLSDRIAILQNKPGWTVKDQEMAIDVISDFFDIQTAALKTLEEKQASKDNTKALARASIPVAGLFLMYHAFNASDYQLVLKNMLEKVLSDRSVQNFETASGDFVVKHIQDGPDHVLRVIHYRAGVIEYQVHQYLELKTGIQGGLDFVDGFAGKGFLLRSNAGAAFAANATSYIFHGRSPRDLPEGFSLVAREKYEAKALSETLVFSGQPFKIAPGLSKASELHGLFKQRYNTWVTNPAQTDELLVETNLFKEIVANTSLKTLTKWKIGAGALLVVGGAIYLVMTTNDHGYYDLLQTLHHQCGQTKTYTPGCVGNVLDARENLDRSDLKQMISDISEMVQHYQLILDEK